MLASFLDTLRADDFRPGFGGRIVPTVSADVCALIRSMSEANPLWGSPRIPGEVLNLGIDVLKPPSRSTSSGIADRHPRRGGHSSGITSGNSRRRTDSGA